MAALFDKKNPVIENNHPSTVQTAGRPPEAARRVSRI
jgi:hypothetical protein